MFGVLCLTLLLAFSGLTVVPGHLVEAEANSEQQQDTHTLTVNIEGEGTVEVDGVEVSDGWEEDYEDGTQVTLTASADQGSEFAYWRVVPDVVDEVTPTEIDITIEEDLDVTAQFYEIHDFSLNVEGQGTVMIERYSELDEEWEEVAESPVEDSVSKEVWDGLDLRLTAITEEDYRLERWEGVPEDVDENEPEIELTVDRDMDITAHIEEILYYNLTINFEGEGLVLVDFLDESVRISRDETIQVERHAEVTLEADPEIEWEFVEWTGDHESTDQEVEFEMDEDKTITVNFEEEGGIPGFTTTLLVLAVVLALAIYQKKEL